MALFLSTFVNRIDRKGRVSVPAQFRAALGVEVFSVYVVHSPQGHEALHAYLPEAIARLAQSSDPFGDEDEDSDAIFNGRFLGLDNEGRIVLPDDLRAFAHIGDKVCFLGRGPFFQIWEPEAGLAYSQQSFRRMVENRSPRRRLAGGDMESPAPPGGEG